MYVCIVSFPSPKCTTCHQRFALSTTTRCDSFVSFGRMLIAPTTETPKLPPRHTTQPALTRLRVVHLTRRCPGVTFSSACSPTPPTTRKTTEHEPQWKHMVASAEEHNYAPGPRTKASSWDPSDLGTLHIAHNTSV